MIFHKLYIRKREEIRAGWWYSRNPTLCQAGPTWEGSRFQSQDPSIHSDLGWPRLGGRWQQKHPACLPASLFLPTMEEINRLKKNKRN